MLERIRGHWLAWVAGILILIATSGCVTNSPSAWGHEAELYFEELAAAYTSNDYYAILDFYDIDAYQEKRSGSVWGGALVRDLLRWNSGDRGHQILGTYLGPDGAITLVRWDTTGGISTVSREVSRGRIRAEVVFDNLTWLETGFRAAPLQISDYRSLYESYAAIWSSPSPGSLEDLYAADATVADELLESNGDSASGLPNPTATVEAVSLSQTINSVPADGPAIFMGPADFGFDPGRAIGIYEVTNEAGCSRQVAVLWRIAGDRIVEETRYQEVATYAECYHANRPEGWWTGLDLPSPSDQVVSDSFTTPAGHGIVVHNGTGRLKSVILSALERFTEAGLDEPQFDSLTFEPSRRCEDRSGRLLQQQGTRDILLCFFESEVCPQDTCSDLPLNTRANVLHELAHAWILDNVDSARQEDLLEVAGKETWDDDTYPWPDRGVEYAAEVMAWGLLSESAPMVRIGRPGCTDLLAAFQVLTSKTPLASADKCGQ